MEFEGSLRHFDLFRYQLLPLSQQQQLHFFDRPISIDELKRNKNQYLNDVIKSIKSLYYRNQILNFRTPVITEKWCVFQIGIKKYIEREKKSFDIETLDNWPHSTIIINNDPSVQLIAVERNTKAFSNTTVVSNVLIENFRPLLRQYQLHIEIEALFEKRTFWDLVDRHRGDIRSINFELVSPNMANISKVLKVNLTELNTATNSHKTDLKLNSAEDAALEIDKKNETINSLVDYASEGGGDIQFRLRGYKKIIRTSQSIREITIDELTLKELTPDRLELIKELLE